MNKLLIGTSALAMVLLAAAPASAADKVKLSLGGYMNIFAHTTSQDVTGFASDELRDYGFLTEGEVHVKGKTVLDNGTEVGMKVEIEIEADNSSGGQSANSDIIDELYIYAEGGWGRLEFGQQDGIGDQFGVFAPHAFYASKVDDPEVFFIQDGAENPYRPNSLRLRTDLFPSDDNTKIIYMTPRWAGFQFGVSYMPEQTKNFTGFATRDEADPNQQSEIFEVGANYNGAVGEDVKLKAYIAYLIASIEAPTAVNRDDLEELGAGLQIAFGGFTVGGSYRESNARGGSSLTTVLTDGSDTEIWGVGATYATGPWTFGVDFTSGETDLNTVGDVQEGDAIEVAVAFEISKGITAAAGYQNYQYESDLGTTANTGDLDADILYFGLNITM